MDTHTIVTYQIVEAATGKRFNVNEEYLAQYHYREGDSVTEIHTTITVSPPLSRTIVQVSMIWDDKDFENNYPEPEFEGE